MFQRQRDNRDLLSFSEVAVERDVEGDLLEGDLGQGLPFMAGSFDGAIRLF